MLVLKRGVGEEVQIGDNVRLVVLTVQPTFVRLGIDAPASVSVDREEVRAMRLASKLDGVDLGGEAGGA